MSVSLLKQFDCVSWTYPLTDGSFDSELVMIEEVWTNGMYRVRPVESEETYVAFEAELS